MTRQDAPTVPELFELDETAWLDATAELIRRGSVEEIDYPHLEEYLSDMARRDRREVESRLAILLAHVLKWVYQPAQRTRSWKGTIVEQRQELARLVRRGVLRAHAEAMLTEAYVEAVERAVAESGLSLETFPSDCPYRLDDLLEFDLSAD